MATGSRYARKVVTVTGDGRSIGARIVRAFGEGVLAGRIQESGRGATPGSNECGKES